MKTHRKILGAVSAMIILLSCMTAVLPLDVSADGMADIIFAAAKAYVDIKQNEVTKEGLLAAVQAVEPTAALPQSNFYIKHAVPGVTDDTRNPAIL